MLQTSRSMYTRSPRSSVTLWSRRNPIFSSTRKEALFHGFFGIGVGSGGTRSAARQASVRPTDAISYVEYRCQMNLGTRLSSGLAGLKIGA
jgi:hypothetical protein